jgi:ubiquinone/menaquinone biosynthesis C-methylase UbiE
MSMTDSATDRVRKDWDSQADSWYRQRESMLAASRPVHEWLVDHLDPGPGHRILEIAAGPGETGFLAARSLGGGGRLLSTDISPSMGEAARKRGEELGVTNVDYRECRRVLVPGGRLAFAVFTGPDENPFASIPVRILRDAGHLAPPPPGWHPGILARRRHGARSAAPLVAGRGA